MHQMIGAQGTANTPLIKRCVEYLMHQEDWSPVHSEHSPELQSLLIGGLVGSHLPSDRDHSMLCPMENLMPSQRLLCGSEV